METWAGLEPYVSAAIFAEVTDKLEKQRNDAEWWRDACVGYFQTFSKMPYPADVEPSQHKLEDLKKVLLGLGVYGCPSGEMLDSWR